MSKAAELAALIGSQSALSNRNLIINGAMNVSQRATSSTGLGAAAGYFTVDRWSMGLNGTTAGRYTMSQSTDAPAGFSKSMKLDVTTADTSIAAGEAVGFLQRIEGQDIQRLSKGTSDAKTAVFSFYAKGTAKTFIVEFQDDNSRRFSRTFTTTTSWQRFEIGVPADTTGEIDDDNTAGLTIIFWFHAGSDFTSGTLQTTWGGTTNANRMVGCESLFSSTDNELFITGVQLEVGSNASDFEHRSVGEELALCQRYFTRVPTIDGSTAYTFIASGMATDTTESIYPISYPVTMRANPSLTTSGSMRVYNGGTVNPSAGITLNSVSTYSASVRVPTGSVLTTKDAVLVGLNNDVDANFQFDAEL